MNSRSAAPVHPAALFFTVLSLLAWSAFVCVRTGHPFHDLDNGTFTDHFSHLNAARIFPRIGLQIWREPIERQFRHSTPQELEKLPPALRYPGTFFVPGWPDDKPLQQSWAEIARLYPPGDMLLVAPIALAYHFTPLSTAHANLLLILLFLGCAHLALLFAIDASLREDELAAPLGLLAGLVIYFELIRWSAAGFYDAAAILPLVLCARYLQRRRGLAALTAYCAAAVLHFRAFYFAPWALQAAWLIVSEKQWRSWRGRDLFALALAAAMALCSLGSFVLLLPTLRSLNDLNRLQDGPMLLAFALFWTLCAAVFIASRAWLELLVLAWLGLMLPAQRHTFNWYGVLLLPWLMAPVDERARARFRWVGEARLVALLVAIGYVYDHWPLPPQWLAPLVFFKN